MPRPNLLTSRLIPLAMLLAAGPLHAQTTLPQFAPPTGGVPLSPSPRFIGSGVELADVTGDGLLDIVVSDNYGQFSYTHEFSVLINQGGGSFSTPVISTVATEGNDFSNLALALGDLNGDGRADLATTRLALSTPPDGNRPNIAVLFGQADGRFTGQVNLANSSTDRFMRRVRGRNVALDDMNGDGHLDIVSPASSSSFSVLLGNGDGTFGAPIQSGSGFAEITLLGDIDGDEDLDVVGVWNSGSDNRVEVTISVNHNNGNGSFTPSPPFTLDARINALITGQARAYLTDLTGDGLTDFILLGESGSQSGAGGLYVLRSSGNGSFTQIFRETRAQDGRRTGTIVGGDFDGDGDTDIAKVPNAGEIGEVLVNDGAGGFGVRAPLSLPVSYLVAATAGQVVGSGLPDIVYYDDPADDGTTRVRIAENITAGSCDADFNGDGSVTVQDFLAYLGAYADGDLRADINGDGALSIQDVLSFLSAYAAGCP